MKSILFGLIALGSLLVFSPKLSETNSLNNGEPRPMSNGNCEYANGLVRLCPTSSVYTGVMQQEDPSVPAQPANTPVEATNTSPVDNSANTPVNDGTPTSDPTPAPTPTASVSTTPIKSTDTNGYATAVMTDAP